MVEDFWDVHFPVLWLKAGLLILIWMASLASLAVFAVLVFYFEVENVGMGVGVRNAVYVNCTGDMAAVLFSYIFQTSFGFS